MENQSNSSRREPHARNTQVKVSVPAEVAAAFKAACKAGKASMAGELSSFMAARAGIGAGARRPGRDLLASRGGRRKRVAALLQELEEIQEAESRYCDAIPENLRGSVRFENAEETLLALEEAMDALAEAY